MATTHLSSYENLKEIFSRLNTKLLNFFAKRSIYGDNKVFMSGNDTTYKNNRFIYSWYTPNGSDLNRLSGTSVLIGGYNKFNYNTTYENATYELHVIGSYNEGIQQSLNNTYIYGSYNKVSGATNSMFLGRSNQSLCTEDSYTNGSGHNGINIIGNNNKISGNQYKAIDTGGMFGNENELLLNKTQYTNYGFLQYCYLLGYKNKINISSPGSNSGYNLQNLYINGLYNTYKVSNNSGIIQGGADVLLSGNSNEVYDAKDVGLYGRSNKVGEENTGYTCTCIHAFGVANKVGDSSVPTTTNEQYLFMYGEGNKFYNSTNSSMFGRFNVGYNTQNSSLFGMDNRAMSSSSYCTLVGYNNRLNDGAESGQSPLTTHTYIFGEENNVLDSEYDLLLGRYLSSEYDNQVIIGNCNENSNDNYFEFGNGTDDEHRHNVAVITRSGDLILNDGDIINEDGESLTTLRTDIDLLDGRVETLEGKVEDLEDAVDNIEDDVEALGTRVGNNETDIETLQGQVRDLTLALADALLRITELENIVMNEKTNHVQLYTEDGDTRITEDGDNKFTEEVFTNG